MVQLFLAGVISTLSLSGDVEKAGGDYLLVPFEVPAGTKQIEITHSDQSETNILDFGVWDANGTRGWGGGNEEAIIIGETEASRSYVPGPIAAGTWNVVIGKAKIIEDPATYQLQITFRDDSTLTGRERAEWSTPTLAEESRWYAGDFHVHSTESGDAPASMEDIFTFAKTRQLDFVVLSDHNVVTQHSLAAALQPDTSDLLIMRGCEITTYGGHGNGVGISSYVDHRVGLEGRTAQAIVDDVNAQGGFFIVNHPSLELGDLCIGCAWKHDVDWSTVAAIEIATGSFSNFGFFGAPTLKLWNDVWDEGHRVVAVGGSDDHRAGTELGMAKSVIGEPTTLVFAAELSEPALMAAVKQGRVVVKVRGPQSPMLELTAQADDEIAQTAMIGDELQAHSVIIKVHVTGGNGQFVSLMRGRDKAEVVAIDQDDFTFEWTLEPSVDGERIWAQVEDGVAPFTITNPIVLRGAAEPDKSGDDGCGCSSKPGPISFLGLILVAWFIRPTSRKIPRSFAR